MSHSPFPKLSILLSAIAFLFLMAGVLILLHRGIARDITERYDPDPVISNTIDKALNLHSRVACLDLLRNTNEQARRWGVACSSAWMIENGKDPELVDLLKKARDDPSERVRNSAANIWEFESSHWK